MYRYLLDISTQLACMRLGSRDIYQPITVLIGSYMPVARLPSSYMPFAYRYPTSQLQYPRQGSIRACSAHAALSGVLQLIRVLRIRVAGKTQPPIAPPWKVLPLFSLFLTYDSC